MLRATFFMTFAGLAVADFYWARGIIANPPNCVGEAGCNGIPPSYGEYAIPVDQYTCATVNKLSNTGQSHMGDPVCGDGPAQFSLPSLACGSSADSQGTLYFRRNADNNNILDVATDENYANLVGSCQKAPDCGNYGAPNADSESCTSTDSWTAEFLCTPVLGSNC